MLKTYAENCNVGVKLLKAALSRCRREPPPNSAIAALERAFAQEAVLGAAARLGLALPLSMRTS